MEEEKEYMKDLTYPRSFSSDSLALIFFQDKLIPLQNLYLESVMMEELS